MKYVALLSGVVIGCGNDVGMQAVDAAGVGGPPGSPSVTVTGPRINESFYPSQTATVTWTATDDDTPAFACTVAVFGGASIATVQVTSGTAASAPWSISGLAAGTYQIQVTCTDKNGLVGSGLSGAFRISAPAEQVAYSTVQSIWTRSCTGMQCHDATLPQDGLDLTPSASYAEIVNKPSSQCGQLKLVEPNAPERSYIVMKLQGNGSCFMGSRMPKPPDTVTAAELQQVRDWIFNGAPM